MAAGGEDSSSDFVIGDRIVDKDGNVGTVRYIGPVATSKTPETVYLGIEWDEDGRGKHDGAVVDGDGKEHRYFSCGTNQGSFLKEKLVSKGIDLVEALSARYHDTAGGNDGSAFEAAEGQTVEIEFVGDDKIRSQQRMEKLRTASLVGMGVGRVGSVGTNAPNLEELDIRNNLFRRWEDVGELGGSLSNLKVLNLGGNRLAGVDGETTVEILKGKFDKLQVLVVSGTGLSLQDMCVLAPAFPRLQELHLNGNGLESLEVPADVRERFPWLHTLNLSGNPISEWSQVWHLRRLARLRRLLLQDTLVSEAAYGVSESAVLPIPTEDPALLPRLAVEQQARSLQSRYGEGDTELAFENLEALSLRGTKISRWETIDALNLFPQLSWLQLQDTPLLTSGDLGPGQLRQRLVARLAAVKSLNHSEVRRRERTDAEKSYVLALLTQAASTSSSSSEDDPLPVRALGVRDPVQLARQVVADPASVPPPIQTLHRSHPRLFPLLVRHGFDEPPPEHAAHQSTIASSVAKLTIRSMAGASSTMDPVSRRVPLSMSVQSLKQMAARAFRMEDVTLVRISFKEDNDAYPMLLDDDLKPLSFFGVADGAEILVEELDPRDVAASAEREEAEQMERMRDQEESVDTLTRAKESAHGVLPRKS